MSISSQTRSAVYHGDFWKIVAWVKDGLAAWLISIVDRWDSTSKILLLTVGSGVFNWRAAAERLSISIDISDLAFFSASHSQLLVANMVDPLAYAFGKIC